MEIRNEEMEIRNQLVNKSDIINYVIGAFEIGLCLLVITLGFMTFTHAELAQSIPASFGAIAMIALGVLLGAEAMIAVIAEARNKKNIENTEDAK